MNNFLLPHLTGLLNQPMTDLKECADSAFKETQSALGFDLENKQWNGKTVTLVIAGTVAALFVSKIVLVTAQLSILGATIAATTSEERNQLLPPMVALGVAAYLLNPFSFLILTTAGGAALYKSETVRVFVKEKMAAVMELNQPDEKRANSWKNKKVVLVIAGTAVVAATLMVSTVAVTSVKIALVGAIILSAASKKHRKHTPQLLTLGAAAYLMSSLNFIVLTGACAATAVHLHTKIALSGTGTRPKH